MMYISPSFIRAGILGSFVSSSKHFAHSAGEAGSVTTLQSEPSVSCLAEFALVFSTKILAAISHLIL